MSFDDAFKRTVGIEGGYSNNPADPGGETMWGITVAKARSRGYTGPMADMPLLAAKDIYRTDFWLLIHLDLVDAVSPAVAAEMFDTAVNCGVGIPVKYLQRALNAFNRQAKDYPDMPVDGLCGTTTANALAAFLKVRGKDGEGVMIEALNVQQGELYLDIVARRVASEDFIYGWFKNRIAV